MSTFATITFRGVPTSPALCAAIERHAETLRRFAPRILSCDVVVQQSEHRHRRGNRFRVHVHVEMPGGRFDAGRASDDARDHEDAYVAMHDSFDAMRRRLEDFERVRRDREREPHPATPAA